MAGPVRIAILANGSQARRELASVQSSLGRFGKLGRNAALVGFGALTAGAVGFVKSAVETEAKFSTSMRLIQAATKASGDEIGKLNDLAIKLGADTSFSANEAADAMLELAKAGLSTKTIMGGGVAGTLTLAAAGGTDLATAATIASNALNTFGLKGKDMASVAAALAGGANASSASVESLGQALQQVGPGATNAGLSLQETVAALSAFDAAGIKGSDAGTSLKTMLARLVPSTDKARDAMKDLGLKFTTAKGEFLPLTAIAQQLQDKLGGLSDAQRVAALQTIFGSDATRAATVLFKEGSRGLQEFIDATNDQGAAQELAAARMSGTEGALERLSGAVETAKLRLGQELAPAVIAGADALGDNLVPAIETVVDGAKQIGTAVAPAFDAITNAIGNLLPSAEQAGGFFTDTFIPALRTTSEAVAGLVNFVDGLPDPIKDIGVQAGIAALVLPRLAGGITQVSATMTTGIAKIRQFNAEMTYATTRGQNLQGALGRLGGAAKNAAGIGGLVALSEGAQSSNREVGILLSTLGGAGVGAAGGPIGAVIGALGGLATGLLTTGDAAEDARSSIGTYVDTLDALTGATTNATRAQAFQNLVDKDQIGNLASLGIGRKLAIDAIVGQAGASAKVAAALSAEDAAIASLESSLTAATEAYRDQANAAGMTSPAREAELEAMRAEIDQRKAVVKAVREEVDAVEADVKLKQQQIAAVEGIPPRVVTKIESIGGVKTLGDIRELSKQIKLTPKQIRTIVDIRNIPATEGQIRKLIARLKETDQIKVTAPQIPAGIQQSIRVAERNASTGARNISRSLTRDVDRARPNLSIYQQAVKAGAVQAQSIGSSGGQAVGNALKAGVIAGFAGTQSILAAQAAAAVGAAIAAAKARAQIRSPSKVMDREVGQQLGRGIEVGLAKRRKAVGNEGAQLIDSLLAGLAGGTSDKVGSAIDRVTGLIEKRVKAKDSDKERRREREILKHLSAEFAALRRNAREQDKLAERLSTAKDRYRELTEAANTYAAGVRDSFVSFGNVVGLGRDEETETTSLDGIVAQLKERAAQALAFRRTISTLSAGGLNSTTLQQLVDAGPEAALATAQAIAAGGSKAVAEINGLTASIARAGGGLGNELRTKFHSAGIATAAALVSEIERQQTKLNRAGQQMARALVTQVEQQLAAIARGNRRGEAETPRPRTQPPRPSAQETFAATRRAAADNTDRRAAARDAALLAELQATRAAMERLEQTGPERTGVAAAKGSGAGVLAGFTGVGTYGR